MLKLDVCKVIVNLSWNTLKVKGTGLYFFCHLYLQQRFTDTNSSLLPPVARTHPLVFYG